MSKRSKRWGGKLAGSHSTVIEAVWRFLPAVIQEKSVKKISPGYITGGKSPTGRCSVKITDDGVSILLSVRGVSAHQELRVYTDNIHEARLAIARAARNGQFHISFGKKSQS